MLIFYTGLREIYGLKPKGLTHLHDHDGLNVLKENDEILEKFSDHFNQLVPGDLYKAAKRKIVQRPVVPLP